jgi:peptidoglycan/xylan/chitin deacetylase (PgdA/CDA1 family)
MRFQFVIGCLFAVFSASYACAEECPGNPDALGVSRVLAIDPSEHRTIGSLEFAETLPLEDHEIVLTFDDGPLAPQTGQVLDALAKECVKATFFVVGSMAKQNPALLKRIHNEGHTIGTHTQNHRHISKVPPEVAKKEIIGGIASAAEALGDPKAVAPFFRFPYLDSNQASVKIALEQGLMIWSVDVFASDWLLVSPNQVLTQALARVERRGKGIMLLHDIQKRTAIALPQFLRELKRRGYRVVHVVPAGAKQVKTETRAEQWAFNN